MAVSKAQKIEILESLKNELKEASAFAFTTNTALTVTEITNIRRKLREQNTRFIIAKKTLIKKAIKDVYGVDVTDDYMQGQIWILITKDDAISAFGVLNTEMKKLKDKMTWSACYFEGEMKDAKATTIIADLPSKETLLSRLVGSMMSPLSGLARFFDAAASEMSAKGVDSVTKLKLDIPTTLEEKAEKVVEAIKEEVKEDVKKVEEIVKEKVEGVKKVAEEIVEAIKEEVVEIKEKVNEEKKSAE